MLNRDDISVLLLTGYSPRRDAIVNILHDSVDVELKVDTAKSCKEMIENFSDSPSICLLDLANLKDSSIRVVKQTKEHFKEAKLVAIHIYSSSLLIDPLFNAGIDGYLSYEPNKLMVKDAIEHVLSGNTYVPENIYSS